MVTIIENSNILEHMVNRKTNSTAELESELTLYVMDWKSAFYIGTVNGPTRVIKERNKKLTLNSFVADQAAHRIDNQPSSL